MGDGRASKTGVGVGLGVLVGLGVGLGRGVELGADVRVGKGVAVGRGDAGGARIRVMGDGRLAWIRGMTIAAVPKTRTLARISTVRSCRWFLNGKAPS